jgi:Protein of unknown function (DUF2786)
MGKANRARRAAKKQRAGRRYQGPRSGGWRGWADAAAGEGPFGFDRRRDGVEQFRFHLLASATVFAAHRPGCGCSARDVALTGVLDLAGQVGRPNTCQAVDSAFREVLDSIWEGGWQPFEVVRAVRRRSSTRHADLVATAVGTEQARWGQARPASWQQQLVEIGADKPRWGGSPEWLESWAVENGTFWEDALRLCVEVLAVLTRLPVVETLLPPPSKWGEPTWRTETSAADVDQAILDKIRALLAKAESTKFEHEAEALTAKAQELMTRHAIDDALARSKPGGRREAPVARRVPVDDPYAAVKASLLTVVASANGVGAVWDEALAHMTIVGFESDLEAVELLFTSLLMQASRSLLSHGRMTDERGRSRTRSFRQSFYLAFTGRIHERLVMANHDARAAAERDLGHDVLPVLAGRQEEVDAAMARMFPHLRKGKGSAVTNMAGYRAGRVAAELANLGPVQGRLEQSVG